MFRGLIKLALFLVTVFHSFIHLANAADLPDNPNSIQLKSDAFRKSQELKWDLSKGYLGNLKTLRIVANECTVRIVSGLENKILSPLETLSVQEETQAKVDLKNRQVVIKTLSSAKTLKNRPCLTLQVATADDFIISGNKAFILFDHYQSIATRIFLNPSSGMRIWFDQVQIQRLELTSNATGSIVGGDGKIDWLALASSQQNEKLYFHKMDADHIGVSVTTTNVKFSIRIKSGADAGYYQPARAPGKLALLYPIWIEGKVQDLKVTAGNVTAMPISEEIKTETDDLKKIVWDKVGTFAQDKDGPSSLKTTVKVEPLPRQQIADALADYIPAGASLSDVEVFKNGGALVGQVTNKKTIDDLIEALNKSPDLSYLEKGLIQPQANGFSFRILFNLRCPNPGKKTLTCQSAKGEYDMELIRKELQLLLGDNVKLLDLKLAKDYLSMNVLATDDQAKAISERLNKEVDWLQVSSSGYGKGKLFVLLKLQCFPLAPRKLANLCPEVYSEK